MSQDSARHIKDLVMQRNTDAFLLTMDGATFEEAYSEHCPHLIEIMSITKSIVCLAVGLALDQGKIKSLDDSVSRYFPDWVGTPKAAVSIRNIMSHSSGLEDKPTTEAIYAADDIVQLALDADLEYKPGSHFFYSNKAPNLLPAIIQRVTGKDFVEYVREQLFAPLDITDFTWQRDKSGNCHGFAGLALQARDLIKFGDLMVHNGEWAGKQLISRQFIKEATTPYLTGGLLWWLNDDSHPRVIASLGYLGQALLICPEARLVCVRQIDAMSHRTAADDCGDLWPMFEQFAAECL